MISGNVLITGAGTLTKAILTVAERENWDAHFTIYSRGELNQSQLRAKFPKATYIIGDVRDYTRLEASIAGHDMVIHGAALKRIPECEAHPSECFQTNVIGSYNVVRACNAMGVSRCIGISTDKACRATTQYGASKLMLEKMFRIQTGKCIFTAVRYGNVVASRGSVVELWRKQASEGKPITLTDGSMTRFFMSPFTAVSLVMDASTVPQGEIVVGKLRSLSIADLAHFVCPDSKVCETGLRSEEKHHEDLVHRDEQAIEFSEHFILSKGGILGHKYSSDIAYHLILREFLSMLHDAESLE